MSYIAGNNATSKLAAAIAASDTTITLASGTQFPTIVAPDYTFVTLADTSSSAIEVVKVTAHAAGAAAMTVVRGQDGTAAIAFAAGVPVELRVVAAAMNAKKDAADLGSAASANTQTSAIDGTAARLLAVGGFGIGAALDLRGTIYTTGAPQDLYDKGFAVGLGDGALLTPAIGASGNYGVLRVEAAHHGNGTKQAMRRTFTTDTGEWFQTQHDDLTWNPWVAAWTALNFDPTGKADITTVARRGAVRSQTKRLVFDYGFPQSYMGASSNDDAIRMIVRDADIYVAPDGTADPAESEYPNTIAVLRGARAQGVQVYGYIGIGVTDKNLTIAQLTTSIGQWATVGVDGIFIDEFGMDYHNTRDRQNAVLDAIHAQGLKACCNTWFPEYLMDTINDVPDPTSSKGVNFTTYNPSNTPIHLLKGDSKLFEGMVFDSGVARDPKYDITDLQLMVDANKWGLDIWGLVDMPFTGTGAAAVVDYTQTGNLLTQTQVTDYIGHVAQVYGLGALCMNVGGLTNGNYPYTIPFTIDAVEPVEPPCSDCDAFTARRRFKDRTITLSKPVAATMNSAVTFASNEVYLAPARTQRLFVFYGSPGAYHAFWDVDKCAQGIAGEGDIWICGSGYEDPADPNYATTVAVLAKTRPLGVKVYGYVSIGVTTNNYPITAIQANIDNWVKLGVDGIFVDEFGFDYQTTRARQNAVVEYAHSKGLPVCVNPWYASHAIATRKSQIVSGDTTEASQFATANPDDHPSVLRADDAVMWEDFIFGSGTLPDAAGGLARYQRARDINDTRGDAKINFWSLSIMPATGTGLAKTIDFTKTGNLTTNTAVAEFLAAHSAVYGALAQGIAIGDFGPDGNVVTLRPPTTPHSESMPASNYTYDIGYRRVGSAVLTSTIPAAGNYTYTATAPVFGSDWTP